MKNHILFAVFLAIAYCSCSTPKIVMQQVEIPKDAIQIAIEDFSTKCRLYKEDSIFGATIWNLPKEGRFKDFVVVSIMRYNEKVILGPEATIGSMGKAESRIYERDGKLFLWRDDNCPLTRETMEIFRKHNLIETNTIKMKYPDYPRDDSQKGADYFFCKDNLAVYKRINTNKGMGYYEPPVLKCGRDSK